MLLSFQLVTSNSQLATRNFIFTISHYNQGNNDIKKLAESQISTFRNFFKKSNVKTAKWKYEKFEKWRK